VERIISSCIRGIKTMTELDHVHFIGIGGIGMSGLARILLAAKANVSGSDRVSSPVTERLTREGAKISIGHSSENIHSKHTIVFSSDIKPDNPELLAAHRLKCPILHRSELLAKLMSRYHNLAVTGTHGKTTTSSLLAWVLFYGDLDPSFAVGGIISHFQSNAHYGKGQYFVAEADESDGSFLQYQPWGGIITNIGLDHLSHYQTETELIHAFDTFIQKISSHEHLFWCGDDERLSHLNIQGISYGIGEKCRLKASHIQQKGWSISFDVHFEDQFYPQVEVALIGKHNALNALAVFGMALKLGMDEKQIRNALKAFTGVQRRCEKKGELGDILILDDYGHHPTEIRTTLEGIRDAIKKRRLIAVFQPHRFTRTRDCLGTYDGVFSSVDVCIITDIYGAGEDPIPGISHENIVQELQSKLLIPFYYVPRQELEAHLLTLLKPHDVVVTLGAGDLNKAASNLAK
jgi:UDP-N-acetylmuramate--alanine ligase